LSGTSTDRKQMKSRTRVDRPTKVSAHGDESVVAALLSTLIAGLP
jgi:hypothetical protein